MYCEKCKQGMMTRIMRTGKNAALFSQCKAHQTIGQWDFVGHIKNFFRADQ